MKKWLASVVLMSIVAASVALAAGMHEGTVKTLTGELVDTGCYLGHAAHGEKHVSCANKCIGNGMPMGLLTADGTLYLITLNHDNADPYNKLKTMAGKNVKVTGTVMTRNGMKGIDVTDAMLASK
jgi:type 1 fimbria pilin